jgi:hypothetical protein
LQAGYPLDAGGVKKSGLFERSEFPDFSRPIASGSPKSQALIFLASSFYQEKEEEEGNLRGAQLGVSFPGSHHARRVAAIIRGEW